MKVKDDEKLLTGRMRRELKTVRVMIEIYCKDLHGRRGELCRKCEELFEYARLRLSKCPFHDRKPVCTKCYVHCYGPEPRHEMKEVMRYSGPRMIVRHPWLALRHILDEWILKAPTLEKRLNGDSED
ncbi:MAG: nitrous oxide-stimulated promoter family protein [Planctomycetes bacterium]|nr:nitrous oxide-stimulated promoter family protein [Planctomycetota bacterium]